MVGLLGRLLRSTDIHIGSAAFGKVDKLQASQGDRVDCFVVPGGRWAIGNSVERRLRACCDLIHEWKPDLIHIHGTEECYGLLAARGLVKTPTIISVQGLMGPCSEWHRYFGNRRLVEVIRMHRWLEIPALRGQGWNFFNIQGDATREREIIRGTRFFLGRTAWDRAYIRALNPSAVYYHEPRILREAFWQQRWALGNAQPHRISFTNPNHPRKGVEVLLEAVKFLKPDFPNIRVVMAGYLSKRSGFGRYVRRRISELGDTVVQLGQLAAEQMAGELARSHVFVSCSFIENNANSICEAQLVGLPVISTYTGGVPSLIEEGRTGLFFPTGDAPMLAARLRELFDDDALAVRLAEQAREVARKRHEPDAIVRGVLEAYQDVRHKSNAEKLKAES